MALIKITQEKSKIRTLIQHKRTIEALGLRRIRHSVVKQDTPQIRGMIALVSYLVRVEPVSAGDAKAPRAARPAVATVTKKATSEAKAPAAPKAAGAKPAVRKAAKATKAPGATKSAAPKKPSAKGGQK